MKNRMLIGLFMYTGLSGQVFECTAVVNNKISSVGMQFAKYKSSEIRTINGNVYKVNKKTRQDIITYSTYTNLGFESISFVQINKKLMRYGIRAYPVFIYNNLKNGKETNANLICFDFYEVNNFRKKNGLKQGKLAIEDYQ